MCIREIVRLSRFCDKEVKDVGNRIAPRQKNLLSFPKLSLCSVKKTLVLKNKCNILENIIYPSPNLLTTRYKIASSSFITTITVNS